VVDPSRRDRARLREMLVKLGYAVFEADTGASALAACEECDGPLCVMFTGLFLDDMSGKEAAERASVLKPEIDVIYISGCGDEVLRSGLIATEEQTLGKPITSEALAQKLRAAAHARFA
jgi:CheY-like chemotaxis protein